jgi:oligopeptide/dipeptide ABC transporter ATP-binding protein
LISRPTSPPLLETRDLSVSFRGPRGRTGVLHGISFVLEKGLPLALIGESGSGKSVLAGAVLRLLPGSAETGGLVLFRGTDITGLGLRKMTGLRGGKIGLVPQNPDLSLNPVLSLEVQITEPLVLRGVPRKEARLKARDTLGRMGFTDPERVLRSYPHRLSGGMNQRVLIAAAAVLEPEVLIVDEPTKGLDDEAKEAVYAELELLRKTFATEILVITHDLSAPGRLARETAAIYGGEFVELSDTASFFENPLHPYVRGLIGSLPEGGFRPIPGLPYSPLSPPPGCRFHPRCARKMGICGKESPRETAVGERKVRCHLYA